MQKLVDIGASVSGNIPVLSNHLWLGGEEAEATATALAPKLRKARIALEILLFDVVALEVRYAPFPAPTDLSGRTPKRLQ